MTSVSGRTHTGLCTHSICRRSEGKGKISSYNWCIVLSNHITHWDHLPNESPLEAFCYFAVLGHLWRSAINRRRPALPTPSGPAGVGSTRCCLARRLQLPACKCLGVPVQQSFSWCRALPCGGLDTCIVAGHPVYDIVSASEPRLSIFKPSW